jgi:hypothetical protein
MQLKTLLVFTGDLALEIPSRGEMIRVISIHQGIFF